MKALAASRKPLAVLVDADLPERFAVLDPGG